MVLSSESGGRSRQAGQEGAGPYQEVTAAGWEQSGGHSPASGVVNGFLDILCDLRFSRGSQADRVRESYSGLGEQPVQRYGAQTTWSVKGAPMSSPQLTQPESASVTSPVTPSSASTRPSPRVCAARVVCVVAPGAACCSPGPSPRPGLAAGSAARLTCLPGTRQGV